MKIYLIKLILLTVITLAGISCGKEEEPFDHSFVYITDDSNASSSSIDSEGTFVATYNVYLSSKAQSDDVVVEYDVVVGDGLIEKRDYKLISSIKSLIFSPGIYKRPIRIEWLRNKVDKTKDNTLKIVLRSCDRGFTLGYPGPDRNNSEFLITKF